MPILCDAARLSLLASSVTSGYFTNRDTIAFAGNVENQPTYVFGMVPTRCVDIIRKPEFDISRVHHVRPSRLEDMTEEEVDEIVCPRTFFAHGHKMTTTIKIERLNSFSRFGFFVNACRVGTLLRESGVLKSTPYIGEFYFGMFMTAAQTASALHVHANEVSPDDMYGLQCQETAGLFSLQKHLEKWMKLLLRKKQQTPHLLAEARNKFKKFMCVIIFQVLFSLHQIHEKTPGVRHNDLHLDNIVLSLPGIEMDYVHYVNAKRFVVCADKKTYIPSIVDLGWVSNDDPKNMTLPVASNITRNHYVDVHRFCNAILHNLEQLPQECIPISLANFLTTVVPQHLRVPLDPEVSQFGSIWHPHSSYMIEPDGSWISEDSGKIGKPLVELTTPFKLLQLPFFNVLRVEKPRQNNIPQLRFPEMTYEQELLTLSPMEVMETLTMIASPPTLNVWSFLQDDGLKKNQKQTRVLAKPTQERPCKKRLVAELPPPLLRFQDFVQ